MKKTEKKGAAQEDAAVQEKESSIFDKKCARCGNTLGMLGPQVTMIRGACKTCRNLALSMARIKAKERQRGRPERHDGVHCRKNDQIPSNFQNG